MAVTLRRHAAILIVIAAILLIAAPTLTYPLGRDQGEFATIGRGLLQGKAPYVDLWNPKPPAVFYVYAAAMALFGQTAPALRAIDLLIFPVIALTLYAIGTRLADRRVGVWAAALFGVFYFTETFWTLTQNDGIALLPMTLAMWCAIRAADAARRSWVWALISGAMLGWTFWFKYPFAVMGLPVLVIYAVIRRSWDKSIRSWDIFAICVGGLLTLVGGAAVMLSLGAWDALLESARLTSSYTTLTANLPDLIEAFRVALSYRWSQWGLLALLGVVGVVITARRRDARWWAVIVWLISGAAMMLVQAKGYDYHWLPMLSPLALLGGWGINQGLRTEVKGLRLESAVGPLSALRPPSWIALVALLLIMAVVIGGPTLPYLTGQEDQATYYARFVGGEFRADESLQVVNVLRERVVPGDSLFIWGFRPEIYYLSGLNPATRFIFQFPLVADWYPPEWREQTAEILWAALPPYVIVAQVDYMPWVTGSEEDSNTLLQAYPDLNDWLIYNYERDSQIGNLFLWRRKT
ncbi:MAG: glycosyltransferase family 39 protein [Chloroflexi bacterium]|nr:glycosyltransferase family 39 protein [Chloroflexota bacterium]